MIKRNVFGSPFISHICNDIVDLLQEYDRIKKGKMYGENGGRYQIRNIIKNVLSKKLRKMKNGMI